MDIAADAVLLAAHDHRDLAVDLQAEESVYDMAPGFLKLLRPGDIVLFVEAGFQFHKDHDLLSALRGLRESRNDR